VVRVIELFGAKKLYAPDTYQYNEWRYVLNRLGKPHEGFDSHKRAFEIGVAHNRKTELARSLRGMGSSMIDLVRQEEAILLFKKSLGFEPRNKTALNELKFIEMLKVRHKDQAGDTVSQDKLAACRT